MLLSNGSVLVQNGSNPPPSANMFLLSPQANTGSYVNGAWSPTGSMNESRLFFSTDMLPNGNVFAVGGEYPKFSNTAEIYNSVTGVWSYVDPAPTPSTGVYLSGTVTGASGTPITITIKATGAVPATAALQNGDQVTIANVAGDTAANGTWTISNLTGTNFQLSGSASNGSFVNDGNGTWSGPGKPQYGDDPTEVLSTGPNSGDILAGFFGNTTTYLVNPNSPPGSQWTTTTQGKLAGDQSDEETFVKLPDGSILTYDDFASMGGTFQAQRYVPSMDKWVDASTLSATNPPSILSDPSSASNGGEGAELGPGFLQPDGSVIIFGANGNTAIYTPSASGGVWAAGPQEPKQGSTQLVATDDPGAELPNGDILISLSPLGNTPPNKGYSFPKPSYIYEYDPTTQTFTDVSPGGSSGGTAISDNAFQLNMVVLPSGQVLLANQGGPFQVYTEDPTTGPQNAWRPTITNITQDSPGGSTYTLTGTQLNGISEGANYGDDQESASNYPIIQFTDSGGNVYYGRTSNWSSSGVATGTTPVTTQFTLPAGHTSLSDFKTIIVIANGIPSQPTAALASPNVIPPSNQSSVEGASMSFSLGSFIDPSGASWTADINWGDGTPDTVFSTTPGLLGSSSHTYGEEGTYTTTITVTDNTDNLSGSATFQVTVSDPPVVQASSIPVSAVEGASFGPVGLATFTDPGGAEPNLSDPFGTINDHYSIVSIDWGDTTPLDTSSGMISYSGSEGSTTDPFTVSGSHTYGEEGTYAISVVIDHEGVDTTLTDIATVSDPAVVATGVPVFATACSPLVAVPIATFTDPGGAEPNLSDPTPGISSHYTVASIDWGDATPLDTTSGSISYSGSQGSKTDPFTVSGSHEYETEGTFTITTTINHEGVITVVTSTAIVRDKLGLLLLDPTGSQSLVVSGNGLVNVTGDCGAVVVDSSNAKAAVVSGNGVVSAGDFDVTGGVVTSGHGVVPSPIDHEAPTADPLGLVLPPPPSPTFGAVHASGGIVPLGPGTYVGGISVSGKAAVTLAAGVYYMEGGGFSVTGGSVTGNGVVIINVPSHSGDSISVSGQGVLSLTAPTTGPFQGVAVFQAPSSSVALSFSGQANVTIAGVVYAPKAPVNISGNAVVTINRGAGTATLPPIFAAMIAYDAQVTGNGVLTINPDDPPASDGSMAVADGADDVYSGSRAAISSSGNLSNSVTPNNQAAINQVAISLAASADAVSAATGSARKKTS